MDFTALYGQEYSLEETQKIFAKYEVGEIKTLSPTGFELHLKNKFLKDKHSLWNIFKFLHINPYFQVIRKYDFIFYVVVYFNFQHSPLVQQGVANFKFTQILNAIWRCYIPTPEPGGKEGKMTVEQWQQMHKDSFKEVPPKKVVVERFKAIQPITVES